MPGTDQMAEDMPLVEVVVFVFVSDRTESWGAPKPELDEVKGDVFGPGRTSTHFK